MLTDSHLFPCTAIRWSWCSWLVGFELHLSHTGSYNNASWQLATNNFPNGCHGSCAKAASRHVLRASLRTSVVFLQTVIFKERMGANLHPRPPQNVHSSIAKLQPTYVKYIALIHLALAFPKAMVNQMTYNLKNRSPGMNILLVKDL